MNRRWVIPDLHGCVNTLKALIEEQIIPTHDDRIFFLGDYVDRGPGSKEVIDYIRKMQQDKFAVTALKGNHEDFIVEMWDAETKSSSLFSKIFGTQNRRKWFAVGGKECLKSFNVKSVRDIPEDYIEWMRSLEYFVQMDDFVLVHAGLNFEHSDPFRDKHAMMWSRDYPIHPWKIQNRRIIHGHMPVNIEFISDAVKNKAMSFIDLDNGNYVTGKTGFGNLVALELNEMRMVIQDNRDEIAPQ